MEGLWKILSCMVVVTLGMLSQMETEEDIILVDKSVALSANRAKVFAFVADLRNYKTWFPKTLSFEATDTAPMSIGKHFQQVSSISMYGEVTYNAVLTGYESPSYISFVTDDWLSSRVEIAVTRRDDSRYPSQVTWRLHSRNRKYLVKYFLGPLQGLLATNMARQALLTLRFVFQT